MAATQINLSTRKLWYGNAADMALTTPTEGDTFFIPDPGTGATEEYTGDGTNWVIARESTVGAGNTFLSGGMDARGQYPDYGYTDPWYGTAGAADNDVLRTSGDISMYSRHIIENRSAVAIDVFVTADGVFNTSQPAAAVTLTDDVTTGGGQKSITIPGNKTGLLEGKFMKIEVRQAAAGTIAASAVLGSHW